MESCNGGEGEEEVVGEGEDENDEGEEEREDTGVKITVMRKPLMEFQEVPGMAIPILLFSLKYGQLTTLCQQCRPRFLILYRTITKFLTTSQSVSLESLGSATRGGPRTSACSWQD